MERKQRYGVALFDPPDLYTSGYAAIGGEVGQDGFYFSSLGDLSNDVIWLTNLTGSVFFRSGISKSPRFRHEGFLRTKVSSLILEQGLKNHPLKEQALILAGYFSRVMKLTWYHTGISGAPVNTLASGFRQIYEPEIQPIDMVLREASEKASQSYVQCIKDNNDISNENKLYSLVFHRHTYAKKITSYPLPYGEWVKAPSQILSQSNEAILDWIIKSDRPALTQVTINNIEASVHHLVNYGAGAGLHINKTENGNNWTGLNQREWMTTIEIIQMRKYADLIVEDMYIAEGYVENTLKIPIWGALSYSTGLLCENLWVSQCKDLIGRMANNPQSAWIHSIDRMQCFLTSLMIKSDHITVHSYGYGRITLSINPYDYKVLADVAINLNMLAHMATKEEAFNRKLPKLPLPSFISEVVMERGAKDMLEDLDNKALTEASNYMELNKIEAQKTVKIGL